MPDLRTALSCLIVLCGLAAPAAAQVPTATGRSIAMSDSRWKLFVPSTYQQRGNVADIVVNFHGDDATFRNNVAYAKLNAIVLTANYGGLSSSYQTPFAADTTIFGDMLDEARTKVRALSDFPDTLAWDKVALSSFSAGYGAVREILKQPTYYSEIDALLAADSLYASFDGTAANKPLASQMTNYRRFAADAAAGSKTFIVSHSQVPTYTYSNTAETADDLLAWISATATPTTANGLGTLNLYRTATKGNFELYGATGSDGDSHLEHLRYGGEFLDELPLARLVVPEPTTLGAIAFTALALARRRRRR